MKKHVKKTVLFGLLTTLVFGSLTSATTDDKGPTIESVTPWPGDVGHGEQVYVDAEISDRHTVERAWLEVRSDGERVTSSSLIDSNNDGYYVSPRAFTVEGGKTYDITVKANDAQGNQVSSTASVDVGCRLNIAQKCLY